MFARVRIGALRLAVLMLLAVASNRSAAAPPEEETTARPSGTIAFASLAARDWDLFLTDGSETETALTDEPALDFNAAFAPDGQQIAFVSERDGNMEIYRAGIDGAPATRLTDNFALDDHPTWSPDGSRIAFVSTRQPAPAGQAWNGVYVMQADGSNVRRLSPEDATDYSPAWSPDGQWIALASGSGRTGGTDLYVMRDDGQQRRRIVENAGWPAFIDAGKAIAFHRCAENGPWEIWRIGLDGSDMRRLAENVSMPRATPDGTRLAVVMHGGSHQQIGVIDVASGEISPVTDGKTDHWNPTIAGDGKSIVYHKRRSGRVTPNVERWGAPPATELNLLRLAGSFPAFSPDAKRLALAGAGFAKIDVMNLDGTARKTIYESGRRTLFGMTWSHDPQRVAFSHGVVFGSANAVVNVMAAAPDQELIENLTADAGNNGFPSYSPDGKQIVFRSGRDGPKNLHIMDRSGKNVRRLTEGDWTDTMCDWSPRGDWITFASDRDENFEVWMVRPDGSGLHKLIGGGGRNNHPHFSPGADWIVFTSQRAGYSAEEVSLPSQPQPYGDLFVVRTDGTGLIRLTHNGFEEGTPAWGSPTTVEPSGEGVAGEEDY